MAERLPLHYDRKGGSYSYDVINTSYTIEIPKYEYIVIRGTHIKLTWTGVYARKLGAVYERLFVLRNHLSRFSLILARTGKGTLKLHYIGML